MIDRSSADRFRGMLRPLRFIRVRFDKESGQADYMQGLWEDERDNLLEDLGKLRDAGKGEDDPGIMELRTHIRHLNEAIKDISNGQIELAGTLRDEGE